MLRTLRGKLVVAAAMILVVTIGAFAVVTIELVLHRLHDALDGALRVRAQEVAQLAVSAPAVLDQPGALEAPVAGRQVSVEVIDSRRRILARSLALGALLLPEDALLAQALAGDPGYEDIDLGGRRLRLYAAPIADAGGPAAGGVVLVAGDSGEIADTARRLGLIIALVGAGLAAVAVALTALITRRALRPLSQLVSAAEEIERTADPERRLPVTGRHAAEISGLTGVLNRMLASLARTQAGERRFLADASHELRTPVTTLLGNVEYASRHGADQELLGELRADAARLARLVDDLLVLERQGGAPAQAAPVDLAEVVGNAVAAAGTERVHAEIDGRTMVMGEPEALERVVINLIDNALVHGPPEGRVDVGVASVDGWAEAWVADAGPGPAPEEREAIFERFRRGAGAAAGRPGSGLGLSIAAAIVARHGGTLTSQGSRFTVRLRLCAPPRPVADP
jgi:two-component system sensor histidine kinase MprB